MKKFQITAFILTAVLAASSAVSCGNKKKSTSTSDVIDDSISFSETVSTPEGAVGEKEIKVNIDEEADENDTVFKLNSVIITEPQDDNNRFVYCDVTIRNSTDSSYTLSTLNNFYLELPDGEKVYSNIRTQMYALNNFADGLYSSDPFEIPASGEFSGIIGGFILADGQNEFTVGFFPTKASPNDKASVITIDVTANDIKTVTSDMLK